MLPIVRYNKTPHPSQEPNPNLLCINQAVLSRISRFWPMKIVLLPDSLIIPGHEIFFFIQSSLSRGLEKVKRGPVKG